MSWQPQANREDIRLNSGLWGYQYNCIRTLPDELAKSTTGGGTVTVDEGGADANAGDTSGDTAGLRGYYSPYTADGLQKFRYTLAIQTSMPDDYTGEARAGITSGDSSAQHGAYVDLKNEQAVVEGNTVGITNQTTRRSAEVDIKIDLENDTTEFSLAGDLQGEASFDVTPSINAANDVAYHVFVESGGSGGRNRIGLVFGRETWYL